MVFIINELDKAASGKGNGNPADVLLTLLDNLGFTDNYMECMVPTVGVYPIATANNKADISAPILSRFAVIDIPDYTSEEKKIIFSRFALPKVLKRSLLLSIKTHVSMLKSRLTKKLKLTVQGLSLTSINWLNWKQFFQV